jgi:hypothetical protein
MENSFAFGNGETIGAKWTQQLPTPGLFNGGRHSRPKV